MIYLYWLNAFVIGVTLAIAGIGFKEPRYWIVFIPFLIITGMMVFKGSKK